MILMSKYKGQHGEKKGQQIRARPSPSPSRAMPERNQFFSWEVFPYECMISRLVPAVRGLAGVDPLLTLALVPIVLTTKQTPVCGSNVVRCASGDVFLLHSFSSKLLIPLAGADAEMNLEGSDPSTVKDECRLRCSQLPTIFYSGIRMVGLNR